MINVHMKSVTNCARFVECRKYVLGVRIGIGNVSFACRVTALIWNN